MSKNFTKKHYEYLASVLKASRTVDEVVYLLVTGFKVDNPNFNATKFLEACKNVQQSNH